MGKVSRESAVAVQELREGIREEVVQTLHAVRGIGDGRSEKWSDVREKYLD